MLNTHLEKLRRYTKRKPAINFTIICKAFVCFQPSYCRFRGLMYDRMTLFAERSFDWTVRVLGDRPTAANVADTWVRARGS